MVRTLAVGAALMLGALSLFSAPAVSASSTIPGFEVFCFYSHSAQDDPIVVPGMPGMATHVHDFAGNTSTNGNSTYASMRAGGTNCQDKDDTAGYWVPVLYSHGVAVHADRLHSYYRWGEINNLRSIKPIPAGLKVIAGNAHATQAQSTRVIGWSCGEQGSTLYSQPLSCSTGKIVLHIFFPNCWDGVHLDSPDHMSHMTYSHNGSCPLSHPVPVPRLAEDYGYPIQDASAITLSSGPTYTAHADYWNTWKQSAMAELTRDCVNVGRQCGPVTGPVN